MILALAVLSTASCLLAALLIVAAMGETHVSKGRRSGRVVMLTGFALLGSRLAYLVATGDLSRLNVLSLIGITFIGLGTCAVFSDIIDRDAEGR